MPSVFKRKYFFNDKAFLFRCSMLASVKKIGMIPFFIELFTIVSSFHELNVPLLCFMYML